jgi:hypothetical protein
MVVICPVGSFIGSNLCVCSKLGRSTRKRKNMSHWRLRTNHIVKQIYKKEKMLIKFVNTAHKFLLIKILFIGNWFAINSIFPGPDIYDSSLLIDAANTNHNYSACKLISIMVHFPLVGKALEPPNITLTGAGGAWLPPRGGGGCGPLLCRTIGRENVLVDFDSSVAGGWRFPWGGGGCGTSRRNAGRENVLAFVWPPSYIDSNNLISWWGMACNF